MAKDGEHDKTLMVNRHNNSDEDDGGGGGDEDDDFLFQIKVIF